MTAIPDELGFIPDSKPDLGFIPDAPNDLGFEPDKPETLQGGGYEPRETPVNQSPYLSNGYGSEFPDAGGATLREVADAVQKPFVNVSPKLVRAIIGTPLLEAVLPESVKKGASEELASIASSATSPAGALIAANAPLLGPIAAIAAIPPISQGVKTISEAAQEGDVEKLTKGVIEYTAGVAGISGITELAKHSPLTAKALADTGVKIETPPIIEAAKGTQEAVKQVVESKPVESPAPSVETPEPIAKPADFEQPNPDLVDVTNPRTPQQDFISMGAATAENDPAFQRSQGFPTAMKYAKIDEERAQRGLEPLAKPPGLTDEMVVNKAMAEIDKDPAYPEKLVDSIIKDPRVIEDWQNHVLMLRKIDLRNEFEKSAREAAQAYDDGRVSDLPEINARTAEWSDRLSQLEEASRLSGSKRGSALRSLRVMMNEDYSLGAMETRLRASKGGEPLTDSERADLIKQVDEHKAVADKLQERMAGQEERIRDLETQAAIDRLAKENAPSPFILKIAKEINDTIKTSADAARERLKGKTFTLSPEVLKDIAIVGADNIRTIGLDFAKWSARMAEDLGETIKPHLSQAWIESQKVYDSVKQSVSKKMKVNAKQADQASDIITKKTLTDKTVDIVDKIKAKTAKGESDISGFVQKLAREFVASGIKERNALVDAVHGVLKDIIPDITREDTSEAISDYGRYKQLSKDDVSKTLRDLKGQLQQVSKLEDMKSGEAPKKTGVERRSPSDEERALIKQVNEAKKKGGYNVTDPETQLRSALQSQETRLKNQITDLEQEISNKTKIVREKTQQPTSPEIEALKARRDVLKEEHAKIFGKPGLTDAQKLKMALKSAEDAEKEWAQRLENAKKGKYGPTEASSAKVTSAQLEAIRSRTEAIREQVKELKDLDAGIKERELDEKIAKLEKQINEGDITPKAKPPEKVTSKEIESKRGAIKQLETMKRKLQAALKGKTPSEIEAAKLADMQARINELARQINEGDIAVKPGAPRVESPELAALRAERDDLNKVKQKLRAAAKSKTTEESQLQGLKTRLKSRIAELEQKVADQDFSKRPARIPPKPDPETLTLQARKNEIELKFKQDEAKNRMAQRTGLEKAQDALAKWRRGFLLSGVNILGKLFMAAVSRSASNIAEAGVGSVLKRVIPSVAEKSNLYGEGLNVSIEAKAIAEGLTQGMKDAWQTLRTGRSQLDLLYGKPELVPPALIDFFGHVHGALKSPTKRMAFERSLKFQIEHGIRNGVDVHDRMVQVKYTAEAYKEANRAIFMQDNRLVTAYKRALGALEQPDKITGKVPVSGKIGATAARVFLPIVKVPSNIVAETFEAVAGTATGSVKLGEALRKGTGNLSEENANMIMRHLSKGILGGAMLLLGYLNPKNVGGLYQPGEKRNPNDVKFGAAQVYGVNIPALMLHHPLFIALQMGATVRRVQDSYIKKGSSETKGLPEGLMAAGLGLTEEVPFVRESIEFAKMFNPKERQQFLGNLAGSTVPQGLRDIAQFMDRDTNGNPVKRNEKNIVQHVESGIPGLRKNLPVKK